MKNIKIVGEHILDKVGLSDQAKILLQNYRQLRLPNTHSVSIKNKSLNFHIETPTEYDYFNKLSEKKIIEELIKQSSSDSVFWDIGGGVGTHSCFFF